VKLTFRDVYVAYPGTSTPALSGVSVEIVAGQRVALVGRNGSGKSTLMLTANGILQPQRGTVLLDGQPVRYDRRGIAELRRQVGVVFQNPDDQLFSASVYQDLSLGPLNMGLSQAEARERVLRVAAQCGLSDLLHRPTHSLSGGEKARVALAGVLALSPRFLFVDELINDLDPWMRKRIVRLLCELADAGCAVVLATHDWALVRAWAQHVIWLEAGRVLRQGQPSAVLAGPECSDLESAPC